MSPRAQAEFTRQWPALERRLAAFLISKGVAPSDRDDLMQEIATRLLSVWHKVDRTKESWPLVVTIALNLLRDRSRKRIFEVLGDLPEVPTADAAEAGIARVELGEVFRAMDKLTPSQRAALLRALEPPQDQMTSSAADKMLRLRARRRLANVVGRASAGIALRLRRTSDALHALVTKGDGLVQALACATCLFVTTAGAASLAPGLGATERDVHVTDVMVDGVAAPEGVTNDLDLAALGAEDLTPDRTDYPATEANANGKLDHTSGAATTGSQPTTETGSGVGIPSNAPIPSGDDIPNAPSAPDVPEAPSAPEVEEGDVPESPVRLPNPPSTDEVVEEVTGTVKKTIG